jgi:hypothetical protein
MYNKECSLSLTFIARMRNLFYPQTFQFFARSDDSELA